MHKAALDDLIGADSDPIAPHIAALAEAREHPALAIALCAARIEEAAPAFVAALEKAADGEQLTEAEDRLFFRGLHLLGGGRQTQAFTPLLRLLRLPDDALDALLGDALTETLPRILAGVFDGDAPALFAAIEDAERDQFVRGALLGAAAFLTWDERIDRAEMIAFLERFYDARLAPPEDHAWTAWAGAIALLGEAALAERVRAAFAQGLIADMDMSLKNFEDDLAKTERAPEDSERFERACLGYIKDALVELERFPERTDDAEDPWREWTREDAPTFNPFRHVGRNDPCPCGSGKKFKKCCLS